jgi:hypothetical protein
MALSDYQPRVSEVPIPGGSVTVRGLTPSEIEELVRNFKDEAVTIYKGLVDGEDSKSDAYSRIIPLLGESPRLCGSIIAIACDEPESVHLASALPLIVQLNILLPILELTFTVDGDLKKLMAKALNMIGGVNGVMAMVVSFLDQIPLKTRLPN